MGVKSSPPTNNTDKRSSKLFDKDTDGSSGNAQADMRMASHTSFDTQSMVIQEDPDSEMASQQENEQEWNNLSLYLHKLLCIDELVPVKYMYISSGPI